MAIVEQKKNEKKKEAKKSGNKKPVAAFENANNKYTFRVTKAATKKEVKAAIEGFYGVKVTKVSTVNIGAKKRSYGRYVGKKAFLKKATVTLKEGDSIELFKGA